MTKNFKSTEVIDIIQKKVKLKRKLKEFKSSGDSKKAEVVSLKIDQLNDELHSRPLSKN
tara:strand:+ start:1285 stop:1461 length:177 start_codon:yes stop_codon:yes gene_type:complete